MVLSPLWKNINVNVLHYQNINVQQCITVQGDDGDVEISVTHELDYNFHASPVT
jgi:hypothetical protein